MDDHLVHRFEKWAERQPEAPCLIAAGKTLSYRDVALASRSFAVVLRDLGVGRGDRIGVDLPIWPEWVVSLLGAARVGASVVPLNPSAGFHEFKYQLRHAEVCAAVVPQSYGDTDYLDLFDELFDELPDLKDLITVGEEERWSDRRVHRYADSIRQAAGREEIPVEAVDPAAAPLTTLYTAGTLGKPKGVVLTHTNLVWTALRTAAALDQTESDRVLGSIPLFTIFGVHLVVTTLVTGGCIVMIERFAPREVLDAVERHKLTIVHGVPTMFQLLMREPTFGAADLSSVRTGIAAGSPVDPDLVRRVRAWNNVQIAYGLTETGPTVSITRFDDSEEKRTETVGRPVEGVDVKLLPVKNGGGNGAAGELALKGPNVMQGYYRMPQATKNTLTEDGFFRTGDLAAIDEDGYLSIVGRLTQMIIRGGYNVFPQELEDVIRTHPAVDAVVVVGVPNEILGELIVACVVPLEGAIVTGDELKEFASEQVAAYKVPDVVRFFGELPVGEGGMLERDEIQKLVEVETSA